MTSTSGCYFEQRPGCGGAIGGYEDRHVGAPRDQHRLVAEMLGRGELRIDPDHAERILLATRHAPVAARHDAGGEALAPQKLHDRDHERRLSCATHRDVSHDDDRRTPAP
jgi:hypothetical protein